MQCGIISNPPSLIHDISALSSPGPGPEFESNILATPEKSAVNAHLSPPSDLSPPSVTSVILSGPEMMTLTENQWGQLCKYNEIVFARTTPEQKLRIVRELQSRAEVVAMTGDGVNDAPSLKAADIGIALGSGSDIAIEAADMVLLVFDNLKTIVYLLPAGSFAELWPVITNVLFGLPQVLSSFLMIVICCFTDAAAATVLVYEVPEADVLLRKPRNLKSDRLVDWQLILQAYGFIGILETVSSFAMSYWYLQRNGIAFSDLWFK
jgi:sodium/potassium-transporting ATPase subunit alpha